MFDWNFYVRFCSRIIILIKKCFCKKKKIMNKEGGFWVEKFFFIP